MKTPFLSFVVVSFLFFICSSRAQTTNIYWSFANNATPANAGTIAGLSTTFSSGNGSVFGFNSTSPSTAGGYTTAAGYVDSGGNNAAVAAHGGAFDTGTNTYFSFSLSLSSASGISDQITDVSLGSRSTGSGPTRLSLYESVDGTSFTTSLGVVSVTGNSTWTPVDFSGFSIGLPDDGSTVYFRLYGTALTGNMSSANWRIDDLAAIIVTAPEPSELELIVLGGIVCLVAIFRRR